MGAEELKELKDLTSSLNKMLDELNDKSDKRNRALERQVQLTKRILGDIQSEEDINEALIKLENQKKGILKSNFGVNNKLKSDAITMLKASQNSLKVEKQKIAILKRVATVSQGIADSFSDGADNLKGQLDEIPVIGGLLSNLIPADSIRNSMDTLAGGFQRGFGTMFKRGMSQQKGFTQSFVGGMRGGMAGLSKQLGPMLSNPYILAAAAAAALVGVGIIAFKKLADATKAFREETGLLRSQTEGLDTTIMSSYKSTVALGASMADVSKAASEFTNQFEGLVQPSEAVLSSVVALNKNMGITTANAVGANEVFQNMAGLSAEQAQYQVEQVALASQLAGVAPDKVMADIADSAEVAANYFQGSVGNLTKAAIQAAKMGTSLKQAADVSDNLLDFENSITAELEASAMLGRSINFNKARELAAQGDIVGAQQSVLDNLEKTVDLNNVNKFQLDAIAKASGMPVAEIQKQLNLRKQFGKLDADQMKAAEQLLASGKELKDIGEEELAAQTEQVIANQQMQSEFDKMANQLSAVGSEILMAFMPIGKMIMGILTPIMQIVKGFFKPIGNAIDGIMKAFEPISGIFKDIFGDGAGLGQVFEVIGSILSGPITFAINMFANSTKMVLSVVSGIFDVFKGIFTGDFSLIADGLMSIGEGILRFFYSIPVVLYETIVDIFPAIGTFISDTFSGIWDYITSLFDFSSLFSGIGSFFGFGGDEEEQMAEAEKLKVAGSINDGIVQDGQIISTNPEDTLIATKEPDSLFGDGLMGKMIGMTPLGMAANAINEAGGIGGAIGGIGDFVGGLFGGGEESTSNQALLDKMDALISAVKQGGNISLDGKLLTDGVQNVVEKKTSNQFGLVK